MTEPLRWHVEVRGRTQGEVRDKLAFQDNLAMQQGWERVETGEPRAEGEEQVFPLVYQRVGGELNWRLVLVAIVVIVLVGVAVFVAAMPR